MKLEVRLSEKNYTLWIDQGNLMEIGSWLREIWSLRQVVVVTDTTVNNLYGELVFQKLNEAGFKASSVTVTPGEGSKSFTNAMRLFEALAEKNMTRSDGIVLLGGGVVGDLGAFVASTYMRGISFVQVPTTLLAQVDSSIGGKTAINTDAAKNLVGTFAQPDGVLIDTTTLQTLTDRQVSEGIAEIVKSAAIADKGLWKTLTEINTKETLIDQAVEIIHACCKIKAKAVEEDEFDFGARLLLNFGHTIGHSIEKTQGYGVVTHGEAVAIGMVQITRVAEEKGLTAKGTTRQLEAMLRKFELPTSLDNWNEAALFDGVTHDKKMRGNQLKVILLSEIGQAYIQILESDLFKEFLKK